MRWKNILGITLLLSLGFLLGATLSPYLNSRAADPNERSRSSLTSRIEEELIRELQLDTEQQAVLEAAIGEARVHLRQLRHEYYPRVSEILDQARNSVVPLLSEEQLDLRDEMIQRKEEHRRNRERKRSEKSEEKQK